MYAMLIVAAIFGTIYGFFVAYHQQQSVPTKPRMTTYKPSFSAAVRRRAGGKI